MVIVAVIFPVVVFVAVKAGIFPDPLAANPMDVLELVQVNVPPVGELIKLVAPTVPLLQTVIFEGTVTVGTGYIDTDTVADPVHPEAVPVTVYVVFEFGETVTGLPVKLPGIQE